MPGRPPTLHEVALSDQEGPDEVHLSESGPGEDGSTLCGLTGRFHGPDLNDMSMPRCATCAERSTAWLAGQG